MRHYDYIIAGGGCAGLSLAVRMVASGAFADKTILMIDKAPKTENDRTWCFWEESPGFFEDVVRHRWTRLHFHSARHSRLMDIRPFTYKMIRAIDFYNWCLRKLEGSNVELRYAEIEAIRSSADRAFVSLSDGAVSADYVFSSVLSLPLERQPGRQYLWQHFKGWCIQTDKPCFSEDAATLMDFRTDAAHGAAFVYILPFAADRAMIEYTVFSEDLLPDESYTGALQAYLEAHFPGVQYEVESEERGKIPMTTHRFPRSEGRIIHIGTAGGATKASSGYTFQAVQAQADRLVQSLIRDGAPDLKAANAGRFLWYDAVLLRVLSRAEVPAADIFGRLFCRNAPGRVLRFLDQSTTPAEELRIISTLPRLPFIKAAAREIMQHF